jgi:hypothetical protein
MMLSIDDAGNFTAETLGVALDDAFSQAQTEEPPISYQTGQPVDIRSPLFTELLLSEDYDVLNAIFDPAFVFQETQPSIAPSRMGDTGEGFDVDALLTAFFILFYFF